MSEREELLEIVDHEGKIVSILPRTHIHGNPSLMHRVVHVLIFNKEGKLLLQKRSLKKDVAPGKWDTSVGGHINPREDPLSAARREMEEELGISPGEPRFLYSYIHTNSYETELVYTYACFYEGEIFLNTDEIDEVKFWGLVEINENLGNGALSDNFEQEISNYIRFIENEGQ
ncbi:MAG: NUDIX hydrolase [Thermodesulfovibrionales bacterium]